MRGVWLDKEAILQWQWAIMEPVKRVLEAITWAPGRWFESLSRAHAGWTYKSVDFATYILLNVPRAVLILIWARVDAASCNATRTRAPLTITLEPTTSITKIYCVCILIRFAVSVPTHNSKRSRNFLRFNNALEMTPVIFPPVYFLGSVYL